MARLRSPRRDLPVTPQATPPPPALTQARVSWGEHSIEMLRKALLTPKLNGKAITTHPTRGGVLVSAPPGAATPAAEVAVSKQFLGPGSRLVSEVRADGSFEVFVPDSARCALLTVTVTSWAGGPLAETILAS